MTQKITQAFVKVRTWVLEARDGVRSRAARRARRAVQRAAARLARNGGIAGLTPEAVLRELGRLGPVPARRS